MVGIYIHVPFCASLCGYCTFSRRLLDPGLKSRYVEAVIREIDSARWAVPECADTVYFGGGTPSLLEPWEVGSILDACRRAFTLDPTAEVTLEANPDGVTTDRLAAYRSSGVNRVSLGVQSFSDAELRRLGRRHDQARAWRAVGEARDAGFDNVSLDLLLGLPGQVLADVVVSVESLIALGPEHASLYLLELHADAPLGDAAAAAGWSLVSDDEAADMYVWAMERLERAGYRQYEISNVARPDRQSRHNLKYWIGSDWIGFGPAAHSTRGGVRWNNVAGTEEYVDRVMSGVGPDLGRTILSARARLEEALFMGLRLADGVDLEQLARRFGVDVGAEYGYRLSPYFDAGLLSAATGRLRLTRKGMLLANEVMSVLLDAPSANSSALS